MYNNKPKEAINLILIKFLTIFLFFANAKTFSLCLKLLSVYFYDFSLSRDLDTIVIPITQIKVRNNALIIL